MTDSNSSNNLGGQSSPSMTQMQIMQTLCKAQNNNIQEMGNLAQAQMSFNSIQMQAGQVSETKVEENFSKIKEMSKLSTILGVVTTIAGSCVSVGTSLGTLGVSADAGLSAVETTANVIGNGVAPVTEGGLTIAQGHIAKQVGENKADSSVAGNLMKGFDAIAKDNASTISTTIQDSAQMTGKEQSIISEDRQSKMYN